MKLFGLEANRLIVAAAALLLSSPARAALQDRGPQDPALVFPQWYRDTNGLAVGLCKSQAPSPNPPSAFAPMCLPLAADPNGFPGNLGPEIFYNVLTVVIGKQAGFTLKYVAALEASYAGSGTPIHGRETVFARIRIVIDTLVPGTYTVTHPFGVEVFPNVPGNGPKSVFFTVDVPLGPPMDFDAALGGRLGPFLQWDVANAGETLTAGGEQFLGDPNYPHTFTGSPFGTNYVRVDGPPGSNLDGAGNASVFEAAGMVSGQRWLAPIPTPFTIRKAVYSRTAASNSVDVWATSVPGQLLVLTGAGMPSLALQELPGGYYGHVEYPSSFIPPASVTITNVTSRPVASVTTGLPDQLDAVATYSPVDGTITVSATSTDRSGPTLAVVAPWGGTMTPPSAASPAYSLTAALPAGAAPPLRVRIASNAGGVFVADVAVGQGMPMNAPGLPVAADDAPLVAGSGSTTFDVSANDTFSGAVRVLVLSQPAAGSAVAAASGGAVTYTPNPGASGLDGFSYALVDAVGISNVARVSLDVPFVAPAPTANPDAFAMLQDTVRTYAVLANDLPGTGTLLDPASVVVTAAPAHGTATPNPDGTVTYRPFATFASAFDAFSYTVASTAGTRSQPAAVMVGVFAAPESLAITKAEYAVSKARWTIVGTTTWFDAALTQTTATCWLGSAGGPTPSTLIGTAPVDTSGKFQLVPAGPTPMPTSSATITCQTSNGGTAGSGVTFK